jgi:hypothetical protein
MHTKKQEEASFFASTMTRNQEFLTHWLSTWMEKNNKGSTEANINIRLDNIIDKQWPVEKL